MRFTWSPEKYKLNIRNHQGVDFEEAQTVFKDFNAIIIPDEEHSNDEERDIIIGYSQKHRMLVVVYHIREEVGEEEVIRIISARKANKNEQQQYLEGEI